MPDTLFDITTSLDTIRGSLTRVMYSENGRLVGKIMVDPASRIGPDGKKRPPTMTVLGSMAEPLLHQVYEFSGTVSFNHEFCSHEIKFESYRTILPSDRDGIATYLIDTARWVGPSHAKALLDAFGDQTLEVIKHDPDRVVGLGIGGLTADRVAEMSESLRTNEKLEAATLEVNNILSGVLGPATVRRAIKKWGCDAASRIKNNPFCLTELHGSGFVSADAVHKKLGRDGREMQRHKAAVCHILSEAAAREGHTILSLNRVMLEGQKLVGGLRPDVFDDCEKDELASSDGITVTLAELNKSEKYVANKLLSMLAQPADGDNARLFPAIDKAGLAADQAAAVDAYHFARVFALVGAPGTGKTYTLARIVKTLQDAGLQVELCAPTGKAAKQMTLALADTCGGSAVTIHSLLGAGVDEDTGEFRFTRNETCPLDCDVLVVDELSMVDCRLARSLLRAVPDTARLLLVGDPYQLPSVGPGAVLRDLLRAGVPAFELKEIKRNAGDIVRACHAIKDGKSPRQFASTKLDIDAGHNWRHIDASGPAEIKVVIEKLLANVLPRWGAARFALDFLRSERGDTDIDRLSMLWDVQVVSPTNEKGELSCDSLNKLAKGILNPANANDGKLPFGLDDKVLRTKNATVKGEPITTGDDEDVKDAAGCVQNDEPLGGKIRVVNGDIGTVKRIDNREIEVEFRYPHRTAYLKRADHELKLAYCMTCHKLQGSECKVVVLPVHPSFARMPMVTREWIYTAMSRTKVMLITVGDLDAIDMIVPKIGMHARQTTLATMLERSLKATPEPVGSGAERWNDL